MRLVALADTHLFHEELTVPEGDVFVHAGDLCRGGGLEEVAEAAAWIRSLPHRHKIVVAGNHDAAFQDDRERAVALLGPGVTYLEDSACEVEGVRFWGSPWQPAFNNWSFNLARGHALAEKWALIPEGIDVLITHGPPRGFGDSTGTANREGCEDLLKRVRIVRPRLHLFGHIHEDGGAWLDDGTWFVNCTTWECERAATLVDVQPGVIRVEAPSG